MNLPNKLTLLRLGLTALFVAVLSLQVPYQFTVAVFIFLVASATDYLDGFLARKYNLITDFGKLMDPLADKILIASAFICLIHGNDLPQWVVIIIISREFLITGLRLLASSKGQILPAEKLGKHKTAWQMITIVFFLGLRAWAEFTTADTGTLTWLRDSAGPTLIGITVVLTTYSGLAYLWKNRELLKAS